MRSCVKSESMINDHLPVLVNASGLSEKRILLLFRCWRAEMKRLQKESTRRGDSITLEQAEVTSEFIEQLLELRISNPDNEQWCGWDKDALRGLVRIAFDRIAMPDNPYRHAMVRLSL